METAELNKKVSFYTFKPTTKTSWDKFTTFTFCCNFC